MKALYDMFSKLLNVGGDKDTASTAATAGKSYAGSEKPEVRKKASEEEIRNTKASIRLAMQDIAERYAVAQKPAAAKFEICGTEFLGGVRCRHINGDPPGTVTLVLYSERPGSDLECSMFDFSGTAEDFYEYVRKPVYDCDEFYDNFIHLSETLDRTLKDMY